ncbi:MAG: thiamine/thiamine pyrophosphate ABC transporter permease ThiP [Pseudomonadota bacterium]
MAVGALQLGRCSGPLIALIILGAIGAIVAAVISRSGGLALGPGDMAAIRFTFHQAVWSAALSVLLAIPVARALARRRFRGRGIIITLLGAPFILPVIVAVLGLLAVFGRGGWVSTILVGLGGEPISIYGFHGVVLAHVFFNLPLATRLILQAWQAVPAERYRLAAQLAIDGWAFFRIIEWPLLQRAVPGAFALIFVLCLTSFAVALTLGGGPRATTVELAIYQAFRFDFDLGRAAFLSLLQLGLAGTAAAVAVWLVPRVELGRGLDRSHDRWDGRGAGAQDAVVITLAFLFLVLPIGAVAYDGMGGLLVLPGSVFWAAVTSLWVAGLSVGLMLTAALPLAGWMAMRRRAGAEVVGIFGIAISPLMLGTGAFLLINPYADPGRLALVVTACVNALMTLPFALRLMVPALRDLVDDYGRLSLNLGLRGWPLWRIVILPRLRAQMGFAAGLGGALSLGDLGVVTLFADQDRATLPLQMYRLMGAYQMEAASGAAVLLLLLALSVFWLCDWWGRHA